MLKARILEAHPEIGRMKQRVDRPEIAERETMHSLGIVVYAGLASVVSVSSFSEHKRCCALS
jgi:hypothetical protein